MTGSPLPLLTTCSCRVDTPLQSTGSAAHTYNGRVWDCGGGEEGKMRMPAASKAPHALHHSGWHTRPRQAVHLPACLWQQGIQLRCCDVIDGWQLVGGYDHHSAPPKQLPRQRQHACR